MQKDLESEKILFLYLNIMTNIKLDIIYRIWHAIDMCQFDMFQIDTCQTDEKNITQKLTLCNIDEIIFLDEVFSNISASFADNWWSNDMLTMRWFTQVELSKELRMASRIVDEVDWAWGSSSGRCNASRSAESPVMLWSFSFCIFYYFSSRPMKWE